MRKLAIVGILLFAGCATGRTLGLSAEPGAFKAPPPTKYPSADAVYLTRERRIVMVSRWSGGSYVQWQVHDVLAILTEDGFDRANVKVNYPEKGDIKDFVARTIAADGTTAAVGDLNVHDDTAVTTEKSSWKTRIFAFPKVAVGSVLEYSYTIEQPGRVSALDEYLNAEIPVEKYMLELTGTPDIRYQTKIYNTDQKWAESTDGNNWVLRWSAENIPASKGYEHAPPRTAREPWWVFTVLQLVKYNHAFDWNRTWASTYDYYVNKLVYENEDYYADFKPDLKVAGDAPALQKVTAALDWVRTRWRVARAGDFPGRNAKELDDHADVTGVERTRVIYKLLTDRGLKAEFAVTNRVGARLEDRDVPWSGAFETYVLYLPVQPGLPAPVWIDGACDFCAAGEIPAWLRGVQAMVLHSEKPAGKDTPKIDPEWVAVTGPDAPEERAERRLVATIAPDGALTLVQTNRSVGGRASSVREYALKTPAKALDDDFEKGLKYRLPAAKMTKRIAHVIDPSVRVVTSGVEGTVANYVVIDGDQRLIPLSMLSTDRAKMFDDKDRKWPIVFDAGFADGDELELQVPPTWTVKELPPPIDLSARGVSCKASVTAVAPGKLTVTRLLTVAPGTHPSTAYDELRKVVRACAIFRDNAVTMVVSPAS